MFAKIAETQPVRVADLATALEVDRSTISRQVSELADLGLVHRLPDPADGRSHFVSMSKKGSAAQASISNAWQNVLRRATADWDAQTRASLATMLGRLAKSLDDVVSEHSP